MTSQTFNLSLPKELVSKIDKKAKEDYTSRSDILRQAVLKFLREDEQRKITEWKELLEYGQKIGAQGKQFTYEEIANQVSAARKLR